VGIVLFLVPFSFGKVFLPGSVRHTHSSRVTNN
jgi:hypothetical protein